MENIKENIKENKSGNISIIKINPDYSKLVTPLLEKEDEMLKNSIKENGLHYPIVLNPKGDILDGHHRYKLCKDLGVVIT